MISSCVRTRGRLVGVAVAGKLGLFPQYGGTMGVTLGKVGMGEGRQKGKEEFTNSVSLGRPQRD